MNQSAASVLSIELRYDSFRKAKVQCVVERVVWRLERDIVGLWECRYPLKIEQRILMLDSGGWCVGLAMDCHGSRKNRIMRSQLQVT